MEVVENCCAEDKGKLWISENSRVNHEEEVEMTEGEQFEKLLEAIGSDGYYQKRFNFIFNFALIAFFSMPFLNYLLAMTVPDHWCHVPGRESTNLTMEEWKHLVLPREPDVQGDNTNSKCYMYNLTLNEIMKWKANITTTVEPQIIKCQHGWDYDRTWYISTAPSDFDWVCDKELNVNNAFAYARAGDVLGTLISGQLGDVIGRKPVFLISLMLVLTGRTAIAFSSSIFALFAVFSFLANSCSNAVFQSPLAIGMEISGKEQHSRINTVQYIAWTLGVSIMPFIAWIYPDWKIFILITTLPTALFFLLHRFIPESPRWLAAKNKTDRALEILADIAKTNKKELPADALEILNRVSEISKKQKCYGMISLFSNKRMALYTVIIMFCWIVTSLSYDVLVLNVTTLSGNPFLNFFYQSAVELPAYVVGMWLTDNLGRRWTHSCFLFINSITCIGVILVMTYSDLQWMTTVLVVFSKFCVSLTFYVIYLQCMEIYPTCLRQTGSSAGIIAGSLFGVIGPYIVFLGTSMDTRYPFLCIGTLTFFGGIAASFLPETLDQQLPETLGEARMFGHKQKYWSLVRKKRKQSSLKEEQRLEMRDKLLLHKEKTVPEGPDRSG